MLTSLQFKLIGALVLALALFGGYKYVAHLQGRVDTLTSEKTELSTKLDTQNKAILQMKKDADERKEKHAEELKEAAQKSTEKKQEAQVIYKTVPSNPSDMCKSALDLINGGAK
jgi:hypothetical protein